MTHALCGPRPPVLVASFCRGGKIRVRLLSARGEAIVEGTFVSPEALRFKTPPHEQHGALPCDVSVSIGADNWTVNPLKFQASTAGDCAGILIAAALPESKDFLQ